MTQPGPHQQPGVLNQAEQQQMIQQIGRVFLSALPPGWHEAGIEYRAIGSYSEISAQIVAPNGTVIPMAAPADAARLFATLRHGMHEAVRGTWVSALYRLQRPGTYSVDFNGDYPPNWQTNPPQAEFADELRRYPRSPDKTPAWLAEFAGVPAANQPQNTATQNPVPDQNPALAQQ